MKIARAKKKKKSTLVGQLLQFDPRLTLISVCDSPCTLETECRKSFSRLLLHRQGYLVLGLWRSARGECGFL